MGKEMTEKRRRTMSVELAIQREMAFRKKIKDLQLLPNDDSGNVIMAVQVRPYNPFLRRCFFWCFHYQV